MTTTQKKQLMLLQDGEYHNLYNEGIKGLNMNSLKSLIKKGLVEYKTNIDKNKDNAAFGSQYSFHPNRDIYYRIQAKLND